MSRYYILYKDTEVGPMEIDKLRMYGLTQDSMVRAEEDADLRPAFTYPELMSIARRTYDNISSRKSSITKSFSDIQSRIFDMDMLYANLKCFGAVLFIYGALLVLINTLEGCGNDGTELIWIFLGGALWLYMRKKRHFMDISWPQYAVLGLGCFVLGNSIGIMFDPSSFIEGFIEGGGSYHDWGKPVLIMLLISLGIIYAADYWIAKDN